MASDSLSAEDQCVLAHLVEDPEDWIKRALDAGHPEWITAKCRRDVHVAAYRAAKDSADYKPRGPMPSPAACRRVDGALAAIEQAQQDVANARAAQQHRINNLFS